MNHSKHNWKLWRQLICVLISITYCLASAASDCDKNFSDHISKVQCINQEKKLDVELNAAYQVALAARPEKDDWDIRKIREQLRRSQRAWLKFKEENCMLIGGLEGGNNLSVSEFDSQCEVKEITERINFLKRISNGEFEE